ncbi:taste receptor type 2 member 140-like [Ctenodactylus gundi]
MSGLARGTVTVVLCVEIIAGTAGNGFIALVNCMDWVKRRRMSSLDRILTALAISRIGVLWAGLTSVVVSVLYPHLFMTEKMMRVTIVSWTVTNHFNVWLSTCLSFFYLLKVANFSNSVFLYLKWRVKKVVLDILLVSLLLLFLSAVLKNRQVDIWNDEAKKNTSNSSNRMEHFVQLFRSLVFTNCMFTFIPFIVSLATFLLLIISLWKHLQKMQHKAEGCRDASTTAHIKALQIGVASLLCYIVFLLCFVIQAVSLDLLDEYLLIAYDQACGITFPFGHSFVLILGNKKLRQASLSVFRWLTCGAKDAEPSSS